MASSIQQGGDLRFSRKDSRLISCLLYGFLPCFYKDIIGMWASRENNALGLANQSTRYVEYKHNPYNEYEPLIKPEVKMAGCGPRPIFACLWTEAD